MKVLIRPTGSPIGRTIGFAPNGSSASLDTAPIVSVLIDGDMVLMQRGGALVKIPAAHAIGDVQFGTLFVENGYVVDNEGTCAAAGTLQNTATPLPAQHTIITGGSAGQGVLAPLVGPGTNVSLIGVQLTIIQRAGVDLLLLGQTLGQGGGVGHTVMLILLPFPG